MDNKRMFITHRTNGYTNILHMPREKEFIRQTPEGIFLSSECDFIIDGQTIATIRASGINGPELEIEYFDEVKRELIIFPGWDIKFSSNTMILCEHTSGAIYQVLY